MLALLLVVDLVTAKCDGFSHSGLLTLVGGGDTGGAQEGTIWAYYWERDEVGWIVLEFEDGTYLKAGPAWE